MTNWTLNNSVHFVYTYTL